MKRGVKWDADWLDCLGIREVETQNEGTSQWAHVLVGVASTSPSCHGRTMSKVGLMVILLDDCGEGEDLEGRVIRT